jgi:hypothetical protein
VSVTVPLTGDPLVVVSDEGKDRVIDAGNAGVDDKLRLTVQALLLPAKLIVN